MGICVGMQALVLTSEESPEETGLGLVPAHCARFTASDKSVPHMGWNGISPCQDTAFANHDGPDSSISMYLH